MNEVRIDVKALARLSRVALSDEESDRMEGEIKTILRFVDTIQKVDVSGIRQDTALRNVMRDDIDPIETGAYTEKLLAAAPSRIGNRIAVKQVVSRKK